MLLLQCFWLLGFLNVETLSTINNLEIHCGNMKKNILPLNRNGSVNTVALNAGQVAMTTDPTGYAMFSDPFIFFYNICSGRMQSTRASL